MLERAKVRRVKLDGHIASNKDKDPSISHSSQGLVNEVSNAHSSKTNIKDEVLDPTEARKMKLKKLALLYSSNSNTEEKENYEKISNENVEISCKKPKHRLGR